MESEDLLPTVRIILERQMETDLKIASLLARIVEHVRDLQLRCDAIECQLRDHTERARPEPDEDQLPELDPDEDYPDLHLERRGME